MATVPRSSSVGQDSSDPFPVFDLDEFDLYVPDNGFDPFPSDADRRWAADELNRLTADADLITRPNEPGEPVVWLADWVEMQAAMLRLEQTEAAMWLAAKIDEIAGMVRYLRAKSPTEYEDRLEVLEAGRDERDRREGGAR